MKYVKGSIGIALSVSLSASLMASCSNKTGDTGEGRVIEIGLMVEFEDTSDTQSDIAKTNMAAKEINDAGGLLIDGESYELRIVAEDHGGSAQGGIKAVERMAENGITAMIGPPWSSIALGEEPDGSDGAALAAAQANVLSVSSSATSPLLSTLADDDLVWRTAPSDSLQAIVAAQYLLEEKGVTRASVLYRDEAWGQGLFAAFSAAFQEGGGEIVGAVSYDVSGEDIDDVKRHDFSSELDAIFADLPDVVVLMNFDEVWQISNRIAQGGYLDDYGDAPPLFFGTDATFTADLLSNGNPEVLRNMEGTSPLADEGGDDFGSFQDRFVAAGLGAPEGFDATRYDAVYCIALAMQSAQSTDPQVVKDHMRRVANAEDGDQEIHVAKWADAREALLNGQGINYEGASGPLEFDEYGDPASAFFVLYRIVDSGGDSFEYDLSNTVLFP